MEQTISPNNKTNWNLIIVAVLVLIGAFFLFKYFNLGLNKVVANQFGGSLVKVEGDTITIKGTFMNDGKTVSSAKEIEVKAVVTSETQFTKTTYTYPSNKELE